MLEARSFVSNLERLRKTLDEQNAVFRGEYEITDIIFAPIDSRKSIMDEFLRLRIISKNIWPEKNFVLAIKHTDVKEIGKNSLVPLRKEFDSEKEARDYIEKELADHFAHDFSFHRIGWQYDIGENQVDLEDIEGHLSAEFKSPTEDGLHELLAVFNITQTIQGPSVVSIKKLLRR